MDAGDDCLPFFVSQLLQSGEEGEGSTAVQTRGGLLEQEREREREGERERGTGREREGDGHVERMY